MPEKEHDDIGNWYPGKYFERVTGQVNRDMDEVAGRLRNTRIWRPIDRGLSRLVGGAVNILRPDLNIKPGRGDDADPEKKIVRRNAKGGVVTGRKRKKSGTRGVGCAKRGHGRALS